MPWIAAGAAIGGSLISGSMGSSSAKKAASKAEKAQRDAMAQVERQQREVKRLANEELGTYKDSGAAANQLLAKYLGIANPEGFREKPDRQTFADQVELDHYNYYGKNYNRDSSMANENLKIDALYNKALADWEAERKAYMENYQPDPNEAILMKNFTNEDFVKDPGYDFRQSEGEKGQYRTLAAGGNLGSGKALKALERYRQDYASNEFNTAFNRDAANKSRIYNFLSGTAGAGQQAVGTGLNAAIGAANQISNASTQTANNIGQIGLDSSANQMNALNSTIGNIIYGINRANNSSVTSNDPYSAPNGNATNSSYATTSKPWYLE